jgi:hypothetical protein
MKQGITGIGRTVGLHLRRQAIGYVALAVALTGSAYAGSKAGSGKVGARDLRPVIVREAPSQTVEPGLFGDAEATCERGERAVAPTVAGAAGPEPGPAAAGIVINAITARGEPVKEGSARIRPTGYSYSGLNTSSESLPFFPGVVCLRP